jgi:hypothetical protein
MWGWKWRGIARVGHGCARVRMREIEGNTIRPKLPKQRSSTIPAVALRWHQMKDINWVNREITITKLRGRKERLKNLATVCILAPEAPMFIHCLFRSSGLFVSDMLLTCYFSLLFCFIFIICYLHAIDPKINSLIENQAIVFHSSNPGGTTEGSCDRPRRSASDSVSPFPGGLFRAPARPPFEAIARYLLMFIQLTTRFVVDVVALSPVSLDPYYGIHPHRWLSHLFSHPCGLSLKALRVDDLKNSQG